MIAPTPSLRVVLYEGGGSGATPDQERYEIIRSLLENGYPVTHAAPGGDIDPPGGGTVLVLGRNGQSHADALPAEGVRYRDIEGLGAAGVVDLVEQEREELQTPKRASWKPWFPVIDYDRCTNCMQCLSFCLFDVYGVQDGKIQVQNQSNCKTDCPACSRVCPEVAILFPKYRSGPINGDEINPEDLRREAMKVDISALLGGDIYQALRDRSEKAKSRFSKERDEGRALKERQRCLALLQSQMDIPPEVLASLPSQEEMQAKAAEAQQKAETARAGAV